MKKNKNILIVVLGWIFLVFLAVVIIFPMLWILISGFKTNREIFTNPFSLPQEWMVSNYAMAWTYGLGDYFLNSIFVTAVSTALTVLIALLASYGLTHSRFQFRLRKPLLLFIISGLMLAPQVALIPLYSLFSDMGIYDTYLAVIVPYVAFRLPFTVFLMRAYLLSIPKDLEDAAYIDGCNNIRFFLRIVLPNATTIIAVIGLFYAVGHWLSYWNAMLYITDETRYPLQLVLRDILLKAEVALQSAQSGENMESATAVVDLLRISDSVKYIVVIAGTLPLLIVFPFVEKYFVKGVMIGSVKG